jgi:alanyl-tRNA synthetase
MSTKRLYYDDSFLREFNAQVLRCESAVHNGTAAWEIVLDCTAFYPISGGQPHDVGRLGEANVLDVRDQGEEIVHVVDKRIASGPVHGSIDWARRLDHMQQHTGQHLLSAIFQQRYERPTVSFHLGTQVSTIDLRGQEPTQEILEGAERAANEIVYADRPVAVRYGTAQELAELGVRKEVERGGILRAIEIEGVELQPCGGTHVQRTAQIGMILVRGCSKIRQDYRVEFVCGGRAERVARQEARLLRQVAERLSCATDDVVAAAERVVGERDAQFKNARASLQRLAEAEAALALQAQAPGLDGLRVIARVLPEDATAEYSGHFATQLAKAEQTVALLAGGASGQLIFAQHAGVGKDMNALLKQVTQEFGGKGGGTRDFARGKLEDAGMGERALAQAAALVSANDTVQGASSSAK